MGANLLIHVGALTVIQLKLIFDRISGPRGLLTEQVLAKGFSHPWPGHRA